jgi:hypothetical protein
VHLIVLDVNVELGDRAVWAQLRTVSDSLSTTSTNEGCPTVVPEIEKMLDNVEILALNPLTLHIRSTRPAA